jgi:Helix-turn-helix domain
MQEPVTPLAYSFEDAARMAGGVSPKLLRKAVAKGELCVTRIGRRTLVAHSELVRFIAEKSSPVSKRHRADEFGRET